MRKAPDTEVYYHSDGGELIIQFKPIKKTYNILYKEFGKTLVKREDVSLEQKRMAIENAVLVNGYMAR